MYFARTLTPQLTSVPLGELQVLPLDAAGEEEVGLLLLGNVLYGHGGGLTVWSLDTRQPPVQFEFQIDIANCTSSLCFPAHGSRLKTD